LTTAIVLTNLQANYWWGQMLCGPPNQNFGAYINIVISGQRSSFSQTKISCWSAVRPRWS